MDFKQDDKIDFNLFLLKFRVLKQLKFLYEINHNK